MPHLFPCVTHGHLFHIRSDIEAFDIVGVVEVVAKVVLGKVERYEEARMIW
jgi:hypothetical protein